MSDPSPHHDPLQSDAVSGVSPPPNEGTPCQPHPETADPAEENSPGEEDEDEEEGEDLDDETPAVSSMDLRPQVSLPSPTARKGGNKRKKGKGKGKRKPSAKQLQMIEEKLSNLRSNLNPIRFVAHKLYCFADNEKLFKKLGLWDFFQIEFDRTIRADFIAQLVANYNPKSRSSNVNGYRVMVSRADLARALKLPFKKEKVNAGGAEVDLEWEALSDESITLIEAFVSDWVLLHEDMWMMPNNVMEWIKMIKEGHPEKVDWAGLLWFMVEKELKQGSQLKDCYYASHLQHLIKFQHEKLFLMGEEPLVAEVEESGAEVEVVEKEEVNEGISKENEVVEIPAEEREGDLVVEGPSTVLTLGQDGEKEEEEVKEVKEVEMVDAEKCEDSDGEEGGEEREEQEQLLLNGKNNADQHVMQHCSTEKAEGFCSFDRKDEVVEEEEYEEVEEEEEQDMDGEEDEEEEVPNSYHAFANGDTLEGNVTGNYLQGMEGNQMAYTSQEQHPNSSSVDINVQNIASAPTYFNNAGKRLIDQEYHNALNDSSKRMRVNEMWDTKPASFEMCMDQVEQMMQRARMMHEEKEQELEQSKMNHQFLLNEVQKRDHVIEELHKARYEETQKKDMEIARLEREIYLLGSIVGGYKQALKDNQKKFAEYRARAQLYEEPTYKDTGKGGLMLTAAEIERRRKVEEEENRMKCLFVEQKLKEREEVHIRCFEAYMDKINLMEKRLIGLQADAKELIALKLKKKIPETEKQEDEEMHEVAETLPVPKPDEPVPEDVSEPVPSTPDEPVAEDVSEPLPSTEPDEPVAEDVSEPVPSTGLDEQVAEAAEDPEIPQADAKVLEVAEPPSLE